MATGGLHAQVSAVQSVQLAFNRQVSQVCAGGRSFQRAL